MDTNRDHNPEMYEGLPFALRDIAHQIEDSRAFLNHECDWEDDESRNMDANSFEQAVTFIKDYALFILRNYSSIIVTPHFDVLEDGSVGVLIENTATEFLIIFKKENNEIAIFAAMHKKKSIPFIGGIEIGNPVEEFLAIWMNKYLVKTC